MFSLVLATWSYNSLALYGLICLRKIWSKTGKAERWHHGLWREERQGLVPSQCLARPCPLQGQKLELLELGEFCFNTTKILTHDFVEMMQKKPCFISSAAFILQWKYLCDCGRWNEGPGLYHTEVAPAAGTPSGSLWARCYVAVREQSSGPCCSHSSRRPPESNGFPLLQGQHQALLPRSHPAWLHRMCSSKPPRLAVPSKLTASQKVQHVPSLCCQESTLLTGWGAVSHHCTNFKLKGNTEKSQLHVGSRGAPEGVQGALWDVNTGVCSRGN